VKNQAGAFRLTGFHVREQERKSHKPASRMNDPEAQPNGVGRTALHDERSTYLGANGDSRGARERPGGFRKCMALDREAAFAVALKLTVPATRLQYPEPDRLCALPEPERVQSFPARVTDKLPLGLTVKFASPPSL
jgi:hypothetical protein